MNSVFPKQWFFTRSRHPIIKVIPEDTKRFIVIIFLILHVFTLMIRRRDHVKNHCFGKTEFIKVQATLMLICQLATYTNAFGKRNSGGPLNDLWAVWIFPLFSTSNHNARPPTLPVSENCSNRCPDHLTGGRGWVIHLLRYRFENMIYYQYAQGIGREWTWCAYITPIQFANKKQCPPAL